MQRSFNVTKIIIMHAGCFSTVQTNVCVWGKVKGLDCEHAHYFMIKLRGLQQTVDGFHATKAANVSNRKSVRIFSHYHHVAYKENKLDATPKGSYHWNCRFRVLALQPLSRPVFLSRSPRRKRRLGGWDRRPSSPGNPLPSLGLPRLRHTGPRWGPHQRGCCCSHHPPSFCLSICLTVPLCVFTPSPLSPFPFLSLSPLRSSCAHVFKSVRVSRRLDCGGVTCH